MSDKIKELEAEIKRLKAKAKVKEIATPFHDSLDELPPLTKEAPPFTPTKLAVKVAKRIIEVDESIPKIVKVDTINEAIREEMKKQAERTHVPLVMETTKPLPSGRGTITTEEEVGNYEINTARSTGDEADPSFGAYTPDEKITPIRIDIPHVSALGEPVKIVKVEPVPNSPAIIATLSDGKKMIGFDPGKTVEGKHIVDPEGNIIDNPELAGMKFCPVCKRLKIFISTKYRGNVLSCPNANCTESIRYGGSKNSLLNKYNTL